MEACRRRSSRERGRRSRSTSCLSTGGPHLKLRLGSRTADFDEDEVRLHIGNKRYAVSEASETHQGFFWSDRPTWSVNDRVTVRLTGPGATADPPTIEGAPTVTGGGSDYNWAVNETVQVTFTFSEAVDVDTSGGTPTVGIDLLSLPSGDRTASYASGSGTTSLVFEYRIVTADGAQTNLSIPQDSLALNGGTIRSTANQTDAASRTARG